ncbi:MAG: hypothetical protein ABL985_05685 [Casimicrobium sp.]
MAARNNSDKVHSVIVIAKALDSLNLLIRTAGVVACAYFAHLAIGELAGKTTEANLLFQALFSSENDHGAPWVIAAVMTFYALAERGLRQRKTTYLQQRIIILENSIDPSRTSSNLLPNGMSNPKDKI